MASSHTIYVRNLNDKINIKVLKDALNEKFSQFGHILDIVAKKNIKARGQAFVVFEHLTDAQKAYDAYASRDETNNMQKEASETAESLAPILFGKPMKVEFARSISDAQLVHEQGPEAIQERKAKREKLHEEVVKRRKEERVKKARTEARKVPRAPGGVGKDRATRAARPVAWAPLAAGRPPPVGPAGAAAVAAPATREEPPNKILFLENLPSGITSKRLVDVYDKFAGFVEVRLFAVRRLGFVEFLNERDAITAKQATAENLVLDGNRVKVTYAKK